MSEGLRLAGQVVRREIPLRDGIEGAMAREQLGDFVESLNAMIGGKAITRYRCEAMVAAREFQTLDDLVAEVELDAAPDPLTGENGSEGETEAETETETETGSEVETLPLDPEFALAPLREELDSRRRACEEARESLARLEWIGQTQKPESSLPAGLASLSLLFVVFIFCVIFFMRDHRVLAISLLIPVTAIDLVLFYSEVSTTRAKQAERLRQEARRAREMSERCVEIERLDAVILELQRRIDEESARLGLLPPS